MPRCPQGSRIGHTQMGGKWLGANFLIFLSFSFSNPIVLVYKSDTGRAKRIWYLSPMRAAKVQASLRIRAVSPEPSLLAHTSSESRGTFRQKARSLAPLNGWACAVKVCHDGMLEDTNSLGAAHTFLHSFLLSLFRFFLAHHKRIVKCDSLM